mmetsp:Transcript_15698/g.25803  ORF Transcript_15698/g.25803 Transcript_15698/m.25803 type:complete len:369 (-) Transcript_15698:11-1117(-)|eukprot:scaffold4788_cov82-Skeletonema_menzelii.AAC.3
MESTNETIVAPDPDSVIDGNNNLAPNDQSKPRRDANGNVKMRGRLSGARKIDSIYKSLDDMQAIVDLLENVKSFTEATTTAISTDPDNKKELVSEAINLSTNAIKAHILTVSKTLAYTKEKVGAEQAHSKLTKKDRYLAEHAKLEFERAMKDRPIDALTAAINSAKASISRGKPDDEPDAKLPARPPKKQKTGEKQEGEDAEVVVPPPANNALIYQTYEAAQVLKELEANIESLSGTSNKNMQRRFRRRYKDEMINKGYVPLKKSALNDFVAAYAQDNSPAPPPFWNMKGRREYMSIDDLRALVTDKRARTGCQWTREDTAEAIFEAKKARATQDSKDPNEVTMPEKKTIDAYHAALKDAIDKQLYPL